MVEAAPPRKDALLLTPPTLVRMINRSRVEETVGEPVMADSRNRIQAAGQQGRKVSAPITLTSNSLLLFPERVG